MAWKGLHVWIEEDNHLDSQTISNAIKHLTEVHAQVSQDGIENGDE